MRSKTLSLIFSVLFAASLFLDCDAHARAGSSSGGSRGSSSSSSKSSSSSSSKSSSSYGNSASQSKSGNSGPASTSGSSSPSSSSSSGGYGNSAGKSSSTGTPKQDGSPAKGGYGNSASGTAAAVGVGVGVGAAASAEQSKASSSRTPLQEKMDRSFSKQESAKAYEDYKAQQNKFQKSSTAGSHTPASREQTTINSVSSRVTYTSSSDYYSRRTVFYDNYRWQAPVYSYHSYNSFGIWDAMMLWFMLDHIQDRQYAAMYYHHRDDPGMREFRKEAERLSTENAELKEKLKKMDESAKSLEQQGVKPDPTYVPSDAASVALAANVAQKAVPKQKSSGFPWIWVIGGIGVLAFAGFMMKRRKN